MDCSFFSRGIFQTQGLNSHLLCLLYYRHILYHWATREASDAGKTEGKRRRGWQRIRLLDCITNSMDMNMSKLWETVEDRGVWQATVHGVTKSQTWLCNWRVTATWLCIWKYIENLQIKIDLISKFSRSIRWIHTNQQYLFFLIN